MSHGNPYSFLSQKSRHHQSNLSHSPSSMQLKHLLNPFTSLQFQYNHPRPPSSCSCNTFSSLPTNPSCLIKSKAHKVSWSSKIQTFILPLLYLSSLVAPREYTGPCLHLQPPFTPSPSRPPSPPVRAILAFCWSHRLLQPFFLLPLFFTFPWSHLLILQSPA